MPSWTREICRCKGVLVENVFFAMFTSMISYLLMNEFVVFGKISSIIERFLANFTFDIQFSFMNSDNMIFQCWWDWECFITFIALKIISFASVAILHMSFQVTFCIKRFFTLKTKMIPCFVMNTSDMFFEIIGNRKLSFTNITFKVSFCVDNFFVSIYLAFNAKFSVTQITLELVLFHFRGPTFVYIIFFNNLVNLRFSLAKPLPHSTPIPLSWSPSVLIKPYST